MQRTYSNLTLAILWVLTVIGAGIAGNLSSLLTWTLLAGFAVLPPLVVLRWRSEPPQTMSQIIQEAKR